MGNHRTTWLFAAIILFVAAGIANATYIGKFEGNDTDNKDYVDKFRSDHGYDDITAGSLKLLGKSDEGVSIKLNNDGTWTLNSEEDFKPEDVGFISVKTGHNTTHVFRADDFN